MKLKPEHLEKLDDPLMEEVLMQARGEEELIAIASLEMKTLPVKEPFHPKDFPSYQNYRRALIDYRKREYAEALGETIRQLKQLPIQFRGGELSRVAIVQGTAREMLQVLELPGVCQMTLDRLVALPDIAPLRFASLEGLEQLYRDSGDRRLQQHECDRRSGLEVANEQQYLLVLGQPGSGKSTFLRKVGLEAMKLQTGEFQHRCLPVMLELKRFREDNIDIKAAIVREFSECNFPEVEDFCDLALEQGKLLVLLDGFDEVPTDNQKKIFKEIENFVKQYQVNRFIISCRTAAYKIQRNFERFFEVTLSNFDDNQIAQFVENWFNSDEDRELKTAVQCWQSLNQPENFAIKELARTPLLLLFLCLVYDESQDFSKNRASLYKDSLNIFLRKWSSQKRVKIDPILKELKIELEEAMLSQIAYIFFKKDKLFFSKEEVLSKIDKFIVNNVNSPNQLNGQIVFDTIMIQQGIFIERESNIYSFSFLTLQEYLTAKYIIDNQKIKTIVEKNTVNIYWLEVFQILAGLIYSNNTIKKLLSLMIQQAESLINTPKLKKMLSHIDDITDDTEENWNLVAKRASITLIILTLRKESSFNQIHRDREIELHDTNLRNLFNFVCELKIKNQSNSMSELGLYWFLTLDLVLDPSLTFTSAASIDLIERIDDLWMLKRLDCTEFIEKLEILDQKTEEITKDWDEHDWQDKWTEEMGNDLHNKILKIWYGLLDLDPELINLSEKEMKKLGKYVYVNWLIARCQKSAIQIDKKEWQKIEDRMFRVPESLR